MVHVNNCEVSESVPGLTVPVPGLTVDAGMKKPL